MSVTAIVLAAGAGTRMRSELPKPLHPVCGRPMVMRVIDALVDAAPDQVVVVVGHGAELVTETLRTMTPDWVAIDTVVQEQQHGTGHAAAVGMTAVTDDDPNRTIIVLPGDTPLLQADTIAALCSARIKRNEAATILSSTLDDPTGYGRIVRHDGNVVRIVEQRDATDAELAIREWNTGVYAFAAGLFAPALAQLRTDNAQGEYYLTDVISLLAGDGHRIGSVITDAEQAHGVNDPEQLAYAEQVMRERLA